MKFKKTFLSSLIVTMFVSTPLAIADTANASTVVNKKPTKDLNVDKPTRFIIQLVQPSLIEFRLTQQELLQQYLSDPQNSPTNAPTSEQQIEQLVQQHELALQQQQQQTLNAIRSNLTDVKVLRRYHSTVNSMAVEVPLGKLSAAEREDQIATLKLRLGKQPGVEKVFEDRLQKPNMHATKDFLKVPEAWELLSGDERSGEGVRVAIIDTGINPNHPMFLDNGHAPPTDLPGDDYCARVDPNFCNDKLIVSRYFGPEEPSPGEVATPYDVNGHGSHVAGTAVGNHARLVFQGLGLESSGMAPGAYLMVYKGLTGAGQASGWTSDLLAALDAAYQDGADIINNSWGSSSYPQEGSPYRDTMENLESAGVLVVNSAGNAGDAEGGVGCPSCIEAGLSVASSDSPGSFSYDRSEINGTEFDAFNVAPHIEYSNRLEQPIFVELEHSEASLCQPLTEAEATAATDTFIIVNGTDDCEFTEKLATAENAGATGAIVYGLDYEVATSVIPDLEIPVLASVTEGQVEDILNDITYPDPSDEEATPPTAIFVIPETWETQHEGMRVSRFSSRGPVKSGYYLKPDITAPGGGILSAAPDENGSADRMSGTSMAAPHIAGLAALLKDARSDLSAKELKNALISSADPILEEWDETPASTKSQGSGLVNIIDAMSTDTVFEGISNMQPACPIGCSVEATLKNLSDTEQQLTLSLQAPDALQYSFSDGEITTSKTLAAGESTAVELSLNTTALTPQIFDLRLQAHSQSENLVASLPILLSVNPDDTDNIIANRLVSEQAQSGEPFTVATRANFFGATGESELRIDIPEGATLVEGSASVSGRNMSGDLTSTSNEQITWSGNLAEVSPSIDLAVSGFAYQGESILEHLEEPTRIDCGNSCDDFGELYDLTDIGGLTFNGEQYDSVMITDNGYLTMGPGEVTYSIGDLPNRDLPTNIIAPFWQDFVVNNDAEIYVGVVNNEYFVVEWSQIPLFGNEQTASFAVWYDLEQEHFYFNYLDITTELLDSISFAVAGMQDKLGNYGSSINTFNEDFAAIDAIEGRFAGQPQSYVEVQYDLVADAEIVGNDLTEQLQQGETVTVDLANAINTEGSTIQLLSEVFGTEAGAHDLFSSRNLLTLDIGSNIEANIDTNPEFGVVGLEGTVVTYQPDIFHYGTDQLSFTLSGDSLSEDISATLNFTIEKVFAEPSVQVAEQVDGKSGETLTISAETHDRYGHPLTHQWEQTQGVPLELASTDSAEVEVTPPLSIEDSSYQLELTVANEEYSVTRTVDIFAEKADYIEPVVVVNVINDADGRNEPGDQVQLSAEESYDELGLPLSFSWTQVGGPSVSLTGNSSSVASFRVPRDIDSPTSLQFEVVADNGGLTSSQSVSVSVRPAPESSSSSTSLLLALLGLPLVWLRRRKL